jgi:uncharacterized protein (TIGR02246 family)
MTTAPRDDERAIREMAARWISASKAGDLRAVLDLMDDDVLFMVPGREPFGKAKFVADSEGMKDVLIDGSAEIQEIHVMGDWAYLRNFLRITVTPPGAPGSARSGYTLSILRRRVDGQWVLFRDANLLGPA